MIGEIFTYEGKQYQAVEEERPRKCTGCCFILENDGSCGIITIKYFEGVNKYVDPQKCLEIKRIFKEYKPEIKVGRRFRRIRL